MHSKPFDPSESLKAGRRALDGIGELTLLHDWTWDPKARSWWLHCRLTVEVDTNDFVQATTDWYVKVSPTYPWGQIVFYPASSGGLRHTFPHQNYNGDDPGDSLWRQGRLCVDSSTHSLGKAAYDIEPFDVHERLAWHVRRAVEWLRAASLGDLARPGEPFELPDFRHTGQTTLAFNETRESLAMWNEIPDYVGLADIAKVPAAAEVTYVGAFRTLTGVPALELPWGTFLADTAEDEPVALWLRLCSTPVLEPWQAPMTWGELRKVFQAQDLDLDRLVRKGAPGIRDGRIHFVMLGFPISEVIGECPVRMHWLAAEVPPLTVQNPPGFRPTNDLGRWRRDRDFILGDSTQIEWLRTENWSIEDFNARGKLPAEFTALNVALIGAGALGSVIGELMVRAGVNSVTICDGDDLHAGNLARHTLSLESVGANKAEALATRLNALSPHTTASALRDNLQVDQEEPAAWLSAADLVLDCTGDNEALARLALVEFPKPTVFLSVSLGMLARRMFIFCSRDFRFPIDQYFAEVGPWLRRELEEYSGTEFPREGVGCWHPLIPARVDDIWLMASAAVKIIEAMIVSSQEVPTLEVMEQVYENDRFIGLRPGHLA